MCVSTLTSHIINICVYICHISFIYLLTVTLSAFGSCFTIFYSVFILGNYSDRHVVLWLVSFSFSKSGTPSSPTFSLIFQLHHICISLFSRNACSMTYVNIRRLLAELVSPFYHVDPRSQAQGIRLGGLPVPVTPCPIFIPFILSSLLRQVNWCTNSQTTVQRLLALVLNFWKYY